MSIHSNEGLIKKMILQMHAFLEEEVHITINRRDFMEHMMQLPEVGIILDAMTMNYARKSFDTQLASSDVTRRLADTSEELSVGDYTFHKLANKLIYGHITRKEGRNCTIRKIGYNGEEITIIPTYEMHKIMKLNHDLSSLFRIDDYYISNFIENAKNIFVCDICCIYDENRKVKNILHVSGMASVSGEYDITCTPIPGNDIYIDELNRKCRLWVRECGMERDEIVRTDVVCLWIHYLLFNATITSPEDFIRTYVLS